MPPKNTPKRKRGRPRVHVFDERQIKQIEQLAAIDCSLPEMAAVMGCSEDTLTRNYAEAIKKGRENGKASLKRKQFELAMNGNATMLIWLGKQRLGQKDAKQELEHSTPDDKPFRVTVKLGDMPVDD